MAQPAEVASFCRLNRHRHKQRQRRIDRQDVMRQLRRSQLKHTFDDVPHLAVRPHLAGYSTFAFEATDYFLEEGYRAMWRALIKVGVKAPAAVLAVTEDDEDEPED